MAEITATPNLGQKLTTSFKEVAEGNPECRNLRLKMMVVAENGIRNALCEIFVDEADNKRFSSADNVLRDIRTTIGGEEYLLRDVLFDHLSDMTPRETIKYYFDTWGNKLDQLFRSSLRNSNSNEQWKNMMIRILGKHLEKERSEIVKEYLQ
jgi:hypothetical protein